MNAHISLRMKAHRLRLGRVLGTLALSLLPAVAQVVAPNPLSPLKKKKVMVLEGGSISGDHLAARTATYATLQGFASQVGFTLVKGDPLNLTEAALNSVDILVFNYFFETQTATAFPDASKQAFQNWLLKGHKGYVGYHTSGANEWLKGEWTWYQDNVTMMRYALHGTGTPQGKVDRTTDSTVLNMPLMQGLPATFSAQDEWYAFDATSKVLDPASGCKIMYSLTNAQSLDRQPYEPNHPVAWVREDAVKTRYFYSTFIHFQDGAKSAWFQSVLLRALEYVSGDPTDITPILTQGHAAAATLKNLAYITADRSLDVNLEGKYRLSVLKPDGEAVYTASAAGKRTFAPPAFAHPGIYLVKVESAGRKLSQRILVY
ncbi:MAG: ThuA domain-containing protein [Fibrobacteres bacterium]|jgi:hypothetical protein|nr:ThuA domain-containing protein [Fibrobacterota bacterium]